MGFLRSKSTIFRRQGHYPWNHDKDCSSNSRYLAKRCKALLIAINYEDPSEQVAPPPDDERLFKWKELTGCRNDARKIEELLAKTYNCTDITFVSDDPAKRGSDLYPTRANILRELENLTSNSQLGDAFVLFYAGHSGQVKAVHDKREKDGKDEYIVTVDGFRILDDDLRKILVDPLPPGRRLTAIFDSCHSGTLLDLGYYPESRHRSQPNTRTRDLGDQVAKARPSLPEEFLVRWKRSTSNAGRHAWEIAGLASFYLNVRRMARKARKSSGSSQRPAVIQESAEELATTQWSADVLLATHGPQQVIHLPITASGGSTPANAAVGTEKRPANGSGRAVRSIISCKACRLRAKAKIIVSISSCLDSEEALELVKKKEAVMTSALCELLANKPEITADNLAKELQHQMFCNTLMIWVNKRRSVRRVAPEQREERLNRFTRLFKSFTSWQHIQIGSENPHSIKEPFLVRIPPAQ